MFDAIREAGVGRMAAEMEIGLAGMADRPFADAIVELEQASLVGDFGARLGRHQAARWRGRDRRLLVAGALPNEAAGTDRAILQLLRSQLALRGSGGWRLCCRSSGRARCSLGLGGPGSGGSGRRSRGGLLGFLLLTWPHRRWALF